MRLRFIDSKGGETIATSVNAWNPSLPVRVEIESRPFEWIDFENVHYDPDPAKWPFAYWGDEGRKARVQNGKAALISIDAPVVREGTGVDRIFAPDGVRWRGVFPSSIGYYGVKISGTRLFESIDLDAGSEGYVSRAFASTSPTPGEGLGERLDEDLSERYGEGESGFRRPTTPFVQFQVWKGKPWEKIGEFPALTQNEIDKAVASLSADPRSPKRKDGRLDLSVIVSAYSSGHAGLWGGDGLMPARKNSVVWKVEKPGTLARMVMRMRDGTRRPVQGYADPNRFYLKSTGPYFVLDERGELVYTNWEGNPSKQVSISMKEIAAFEIETQNFEPPVYLVARVPPAG